ncbi:MAG: O-antigen polymerase [Pseudomonadota bacterium]
MYIGTLAIFGMIWLMIWSKYRDPFHPAMFFLPMFGFLYGIMPLELISEDADRFYSYSGDTGFVKYQSIAVGLVLCLIAGVMFATRSISARQARWQTLRLRSPKTVRYIAIVLGTLGFSAWLSMIYSAGGFGAAYGSAYGGGWVSSGYIREMRYLGLVGALLIYISCSGRRIKPMDWALICFCVAPTLIHAFLGARRGPLFLGAIISLGGYVYFTRKRISLPVLATAGFILGTTMLFLVANRNQIYLGSEVTAGFESPADFLVRWNSNEYLIGSAAIKYTDAEGAFHGRRELAWIIGRLLPGFIWPTVWSDLPQMLGIDVNLRLNGGVDPERLAALAGWRPSVGSAEGYAGAMYMEFGFLSPLAAFLVGFAYGKVWAAARHSLPARVIYLFMVATSVYLAMQSFDPWFYRMFLFGIPTFLALQFVKTAPAVPQVPAPRRPNRPPPRRFQRRPLRRSE